MNRIKDAKKQTIDGVLFLQGVYKTDCDRIEDFFHSRLLHETEKSVKIFDKMPLLFTSVKEWPISINLLCWNCSRPFKTRPWFEPQSINPVSSGKVGEYVAAADLVKSGKIIHDYRINAKGCFCSPNCAMRYIIVHSKSLAERLDKTAMLLFVYKIFTNQSITGIEPSPSVYELQQYGGEMTDAEYQKNIDEFSNIYSKKENDTFINNCTMYFNNFTPI